MLEKVEEASDPGPIRDRLRAAGPALVALSGGVDSAVVAHLARLALGDAAVAVTLTGPAVPPGELERARAVARHSGILHAVVPVDPLGDPEYRANPTNRCFFCRRTEGARLRAWGEEHGVVQFLDGVHRDDLGEERPGIAALDAAGFRHPLADAGWGKAEVRAYARAVRLPNWDAPSEACLASRVRHGVPISVDLLARLGDAESWLHQRGYRRVRVRTDGVGARIEVDPSDVPRLLREAENGSVTARLSGLGFATVSIDPAGYRARPGA